ncbi:uncharacterized protein A4U43_UnF6410 [Asparagus officinalis]|uniref:Uncharacterized protein n=1 Tax=Asparagus officinalis TaxID=4686 RepID=A0A1R3L6H5_ASPOF|nr:uncharacterized protein A4U43_UnF6410 [Asparagus officinalis]
MSTPVRKRLMRDFKRFLGFSDELWVLICKPDDTLWDGAKSEKQSRARSTPPSSSMASSASSAPPPPSPPLSGNEDSFLYSYNNYKRQKVDLRGDLFGMLNAHPLAPPVSLHHLDTVDPLYPGKNRLEGLKHLFEAIDADPGMVFQQIICYDNSNLLTVSVSWGYAVQFGPSPKHVGLSFQVGFGQLQNPKSKSQDWPRKSSGPACRASNPELISPKDLLQACALWEKIDVSETRLFGSLGKLLMEGIRHKMGSPRGHSVCNITWRSDDILYVLHLWPVVSWIMLSLSVIIAIAFEKFVQRRFKRIRDGTGTTVVSVIGASWKEASSCIRAGLCTYGISWRDIADPELECQEEEDEILSSSTGLEEEEEEERLEEEEEILSSSAWRRRRRRRSAWRGRRRRSAWRSRRSAWWRRRRRRRRS